MKNNIKNNIKLCLVCSSGGHLLQLMQLEDWWSNYNRFWVTFKKEDSLSILQDEVVYWAYYPTTRNYINLIKNTFLAIKFIYTEKPDVILSTGAGLAIPFFIFGKLFGTKTIFIDAFNRIDSPTLTGKVVQHFADKFYVQWHKQKRNYKNAEYIGRLL